MILAKTEKFKNTRNLIKNNVTIYVLINTCFELNNCDRAKNFGTNIKYPQ